MVICELSWIEVMSVLGGLEGMRMEGTGNVIGYEG